MNDHIHLFATEAEFLSAYTNDYVEPWVSFTMESSGMSFNKEQTPPTHDYSKDCLTFNITSAGTIVWKMFSQTSGQTISYTKDNGKTWEDITSTPEGTIINVETGDKIMFKGDNPTYGYNYGQNTFSGSTAEFSVEGNIMSLIYGDNFINQTTLKSGYTFHGLFDCCTGLTSAENLILPATTLTENCYMYMFYGCSSLTTAPEIPATTLAQNCYQSMFSDCSSLTTAPELPATTLTEYCYYCMFGGCTGLAIAPELPATTLAYGCYENMFYDCTSLTSAPELPATTLVENCYFKMFYGCNSLNYIKCLATDISADECTDYWVGSMSSGSGSGSGGGVSPTGTFVKAASMNDWSSKASGAGIPDGWTVQDAS